MEATSLFCSLHPPPSRFQASEYTGKHAIIIGTGPSGLEGAIRLCNYGATHVTIVSRGSSSLLQKATQCDKEKNPYYKASFCRIRTFLREGLLTLLDSSNVVDANATHATVKTLQAGGAHPTFDAVRADHIIAAVGFGSDVGLIQSMGFLDGSINRYTLETSLSSVYSLGLGGTHPWQRTGNGLLQKYIEESQTEVVKICRALVARIAHPALHGGSARPRRR